MNTFLPSPDFKRSAEILDDKRLGKQRVEAMQILKINIARTDEFSSHICDFCGKLFLNPSPVDFEVHSLVQVARYGQIPWENHPAVRMWRGYEGILAYYGFVMCEEWIKRGFKDRLLQFFGGFLHENLHSFQPNIDFLPEDGSSERTFAMDNPFLFWNAPEWMQNIQVIFDFCYSHRANLMRKDPIFYGKYGWDFFENYNSVPYKWNREFWK